MMYLLEKHLYMNNIHDNIDLQVEYVYIYFNLLIFTNIYKFISNIF